MILSSCLADRLSIYPRHPVKRRSEGRWLMRTGARGAPGCKGSSRSCAEPLQNNGSPSRAARRTVHRASGLPSALHAEGKRDAVHRRAPDLLGVNPHISFFPARAGGGCSSRASVFSCSLLSLHLSASRQNSSCRKTPFLLQPCSESNCRQHTGTTGGEPRPCTAPASPPCSSSSPLLSSIFP